MSENEIEEIQMYCCLPFSYAVKHGLIKIDTERIEVEISLKSSISESEKEKIWDELYNKAHISNIHPDYFYMIHCPWCGTHVQPLKILIRAYMRGNIAAKKIGRDRFQEIFSSIALGWDAAGGLLA